ncbi:MAG: type I secretion system permease/ATPase [Methylococcaceae bacterium]|nr:type I secretion system permease/ATPase [Methylococcaceae bacterium]
MQPTTLRDLLSQCRQYFVYAGWFSLAINMLLLSTPLFMLQVFDRVMHSRSNETLVLLLLIFGFALAGSSFLDMIRARLLARAGVAIQHLLRRPVVINVLQLKQQGNLNAHALDDISVLESFLSGHGIQALFEIPWIPFYFLVLYAFHPILCVVAVIGALVLSGLTVYEEKATAYKHAKGDDLQRKASDYIGAAFRNGETIRALGMQNALLARWERMHDLHLSGSVQAVDASSGIYATSKFIRNLLSILQMAAAAALIINAEHVTPGIMVASTIIMGRAVAPITMVIGSWKYFVKARKAYERLNKMLEGELGEENLLELPPPSGALSVDRVFYSTRQQSILRGIRFEVPAGEALGIVGPSGSGKSTLARLLLGIQRPDDGVVRLDGVDVWRWANQGLGRYVGYLPQVVRLFPGTVAENIARLQDIQACAEDVIAAAKLARAHDMILKLPKGYDSDVGEDGGFLSGGQRQQIGLARALFGNPCLLVLDEPNANLDGEAEAHLRQLLRELKQRGTSIVMVGHKPSLMSDMDKLLVLKEGRLAMFGPRGEIIGKISSEGGEESAVGTPAMQVVR